MALTLLALVAVGWLAQGRRRTAASAALRVGAHNGVAGLAIGASLASGSTVLATLLTMAFALHRTLVALGLQLDETSGGAVRPVWWGLLALAVLPALVGVLVGGHAFAPRWAALALAAGAGAILHVTVGTALLLAHRAQRGDRTATVLCGLALGLTVMYASTLLVEP
jgi:zinc transporter ZupT